MAIVMVTEVPGAGTDFAEGMRSAGVVDALQTARGFRGHWSGATESGYRVIELWESRADYEAWYEGHIAPNLPPNVDPTPPELFECNFQIAPAA